MIVSDDLGYSDLSCYGGSILTPRIDELARSGVRFTQSYVSGAVCAPTRAGLMTGRYQARFGYERLTGPIPNVIEKDYGLDVREATLPQLLKAAGYKTGAIGKWHLGYNEKYHPNSRGFDFFFGFLAGGHDYFLWDQPVTGTQGGPILRNREKAQGRGYITEAFTREAEQFIRSNREQPFFLYLAYFNVHSPLQVPPRFLPEGDDSNRGKLIGMVSALDEGVGRVLDALKQNGLEENTLVVFINDNGSPLAELNAPLSGGKFTLREGGVRVPMIWRLPGKRAGGTTYDQPVIALDLLPTLVTLAGGKLPTDRVMDGVDLMPFFTGENKARPHDTLYWRYEKELAVRDGDLKLRIVQGQPPELFDLATDAPEKTNLATGRTDEVKRLREKLKAWEAEMASPEKK